MTDLATNSKDHTPREVPVLAFADKALMAEIAVAEAPVDDQAFHEGITRHCLDEVLQARAQREKEAQALMPKLHALRKGPEDTRTVEEVLEDIPEERSRLQAIAKWYPFQSSKMLGCALVGLLGLMTEVPLIGPIIVNPMRGNDGTMDVMDWILATVILASLLAIFAVALHYLADVLGDRVRPFVKVALGLTALWMLTQAPYLSGEVHNALAEALGQVAPGASQGSTFFRSMAALLTGGVAALCFDSAYRGYRQQQACTQATNEDKDLATLHTEGRRLMREHGDEKETAVQRIKTGMRQGSIVIQTEFAHRAANITGVLRDTLNMPLGGAPMGFRDKGGAPDWIEKLARSVMPPAIDHTQIRRDELSQAALDRLSDHALHLINSSSATRSRALTATTTTPPFTTSKEIQTNAV